METAKKDKQIFLVLVPHRDIRIKLQKYSDLLYKNSLTEVSAAEFPAYSFPCIAPLASLSRSLNEDELKTFARSLRETTGWEKINITEASTCPFPISEGTALFGPALDLNVSRLSISSSKIKNFFFPIIIGSCLIPKTNKQQLSGLCAFASSQEKTAFRAAAIANMYWKPVKLDGEIAYKWKIGKLCWLPKK